MTYYYEQKLTFPSQDWTKPDIMIKYVIKWLICKHIYIHIYIYIERERERELGRGACPVNFKSLNIINTKDKRKNIIRKGDDQLSFFFPL